MKTALLLALLLLFITGCDQPIDKETVKNEILQTEKAFAQMTAEKGIAEAFFFYAAENAVIKRENDTLVVGKDQIRAYYDTEGNKNAIVNWSPDFIEVSNDGTMAYTYGKYLWKFKGEKGDTIEYKGVFHTVWKRQSDNSWKYVWD
jgi:ketosteroid isomerase-like protein